MLPPAEMSVHAEPPERPDWWLRAYDIGAGILIGIAIEAAVVLAALAMWR